MASRHVSNAGQLSASEIAHLARLERGMTVAVMGGGTEIAEVIQGTVGPSGRVIMIGEPHHSAATQPESCHRLLMVRAWEGLSDPVRTLHELTKRLGPHGTLLVVERHGRIRMNEMVQLLERNKWTIHRHGDAGPDHYYVEATVTDESVQS